MKYTIETIPTGEIFYLRSVGPYGQEANFQMMATFKKWIKANHLTETLQETGILGIPWDNPQEVPGENCRYDLALFKVAKKEIELKEVKQGLFVGGSYAVFKLPHTRGAVTHFWQTIHQYALDKELQLRDCPIIERFREEVGAQNHCEFLVPII
ncbi:GyrI-like domain-containing protein [Enterococcus sp. LJL98]